MRTLTLKQMLAEADSLLERLAEANAEFVARMKKGKPDRAPPSRWASQKLQSRPFQSKGKRNGND